MTEPSAADRRWLTIPEAAARLGIHPRTGYRLARQGVLPLIRVGVRRYRVPLAALEEMERTTGRQLGEILAGGYVGG
jgi:excisionase family DNA binding protein